MDVKDGGGGGCDIEIGWERGRSGSREGHGHGSTYGGRGCDVAGALATVRQGKRGRGC